MYKEMVDDKGMDSEKVLHIFHAKSRDNARTPVQWNDNPQAGFTTGTPWIKVNPNYKKINVAQALVDQDSIFHYYKKLIRLRKEYPVVVYGIYDLILESHEKIYAFTRTLDDDRLLVILNFSKDSPTFELPADIGHSSSELLISNYAVDPSEDIQRIKLRPYEARVYRLV